jgi:hypothetical protein
MPADCGLALGISSLAVSFASVPRNGGGVGLGKLFRFNYLRSRFRGTNPSTVQQAQVAGARAPRLHDSRIFDARLFFTAGGKRARENCYGALTDKRFPVY